jgi:selenoprotein W-related protein
VVGVWRSQLARSRASREVVWVEFSIIYCRPCGYRVHAEGLASTLRDRFGASANLEEGQFGQFDVLLDGELVASKGGFWKRKFTHGPPPEPQILEAIAHVLAGREGNTSKF